MINYLTSLGCCDVLMDWLHCKQTLMEIKLLLHCVVPENIHTSPRRVFSSLTPHPTRFSIPEGFALLPLPPGNSESKNLIYFDLLRAVIKIKLS